MAFKIIEIAAPEERVRAVEAAAEEFEATDVNVGAPLGDGRRLIRPLVGDIDRQALLDRLLSALGKSEDWHVVILPTDVVVLRDTPEEKKPDPEEEARKKREKERASREELYNAVSEGVHLDADFLLLVFLSTVVASVGLETNDVAVVIGAMVIAPLLGPNVAFVFATAIGDRRLMASAALSGGLGTIASIAIGAGLTLLIPLNLDSAALLARTSLDYQGIILALASGAAAALSVTARLSNSLVGVMVAVALLPPAATLGIMAAAGRTGLAIGAAMLLAANIACVNIAAQIVFIARGVRPRLWHERKSARQAVILNLAIWIALLCVLAGALYLRQTGRG